MIPVQEWLKAYQKQLKSERRKDTLRSIGVAIFSATGMIILVFVVAIIIWILWS